MDRKLMMAIIFVAGLLIFIYPFISNWFAKQEHYRVINHHNTLLKQMSEAEIAQAREQAENYNASLDVSSTPIEDPFAVPTSDNANTGYYNALNIGETMGSLEIPVIDVRLPIYHGVSDDVLQRGVGHMSNSSLPVGGLGTHAALTGHRGLPSAELFRHLDEVQLGDVFYIHTLDDTLAYKVDDVRIVLPTAVDWLQIDTDKDYVTLITCDPYMINTHRLLVRGERIPYDEDKAELNVTADQESGAEQLRSMHLLAGIIIVIALAGICYIFFHRYRQRVRKG